MVQQRHIYVCTDTCTCTVHVQPSCLFCICLLLQEPLDEEEKKEGEEGEEEMDDEVDSPVSASSLRIDKTIASSWDQMSMKVSGLVSVAHHNAAVCGGVRTSVHGLWYMGEQPPTCGLHMSERDCSLH